MAAVDDTDYELRDARPEDARAIEELDGSFTTRTVFHVTVAEDGFTLRETPVDPPVHKAFPAEDAGVGPAAGEDPDRRTFVAVGPDGRPVGFAAVSYVPWNRRLAIEDIEVASAHRGRGVGRALVDRAVAFARERGAGHIWLEVTNINAPAIHAYRRMGFTFCGLDTALYDGTPASGEHALYMSMPCPPKPPAVG
ncbi:N-acetyltransferase family protein [Streptomyces sp. enrichment culture]|uniref:GNAT family N-acetyltransferase n=1 Tax=Streptomyces sp. enrichment culture TaxID=1795815 RepID=UPI003F56566B